jgi:hypothetical protein
MTWKLNLSYAAFMRHAIIAIGVMMACYHIWAIAFGTPEEVWFRGTHLLFALTLIFLIYRRSGAAEGVPSMLDIVLLVLAIAPSASVAAALKTDGNHLFEDVIQEEAHPHALAAAVLADAIHAIVPVAAAKERQAAFAGLQ